MDVTPFVQLLSTSPSHVCQEPWALSIILVCLMIICVICAMAQAIDTVEEMPLKTILDLQVRLIYICWPCWTIFAFLKLFDSDFSILRVRDQNRISVVVTTELVFVCLSSWMTAVQTQHCWRIITAVTFGAVLSHIIPLLFKYWFNLILTTCLYTSVIVYSNVVMLGITSWFLTWYQ